MTPFATVTDYEARYGDVPERGRLEVLLSDASVFIASQPGFPRRDGPPAEALAAVACALVHRKLLAGRYAGFSNVSQGAGGQTASVAVYNPSGDFYLTKQERRLLRLPSGRVGCTDPFGGDADD